MAQSDKPRTLPEKVWSDHVIVTGAGDAFCAGGDVHTFASKGEGMPDYLRVATAWLQNAVTGLMRLEAPVISAVHGFAAGGGGFGLVRRAGDLAVRHGDAVAREEFLRLIFVQFHAVPPRCSRCPR